MSSPRISTYSFIFLSQTHVFYRPSPGGSTDLLPLNFTQLDLACTLVVHDNDAVWGDLALRHLEGGGDRAVGKQAFSSNSQ